MGINKTLLATIIANMGVLTEGTERFFFNLSGAVNGVITDGQGIATISQVGNLNHMRQL